MRSLPKKYGYAKRQSLSKMTVNDAQSILTELIELEFPSTFQKSVFFALFKTYGIPSISSLLVATGQFGDTQKSLSKRSADTGVLLLNLVFNKPTDDRSIDAIARMNYLHDRHRKTGKISDQDMLYTLGMFALEPARWIRDYEWRDLTELERCALGTFWKDVGDAMLVPFDKLPGSAAGWRDGLHWLGEMEAWSKGYEIERMIPAESNNKLAEKTLCYLLWNVPARFQNVGRNVAYVLMGERLVSAMGSVSFYSSLT
ncbi:MAG: hypothetical protein Q9218_000726 [Villophora microphyllina]